MPERWQGHTRSCPLIMLRWRKFLANPGVGKFWGGGGGEDLGWRSCSGTTWQKYLNMVPSWKHYPASPIQHCLWFPSSWKFGFDLQGAEKNMNLFERKTTLQKAVYSKEPLATVFFAIFGYRLEQDSVSERFSLKKKMSWGKVKLTSPRLWLQAWSWWRNKFLCL